MRDLSGEEKIIILYQVYKEVFNQPDYLYENTCTIISCIHFSFSLHKRERKGGKDLQYRNKHRLKFIFPVGVLGCYPYMSSGLSTLSSLNRCLFTN